MGQDLARTGSDNEERLVVGFVNGSVAERVCLTSADCSQEEETTHTHNNNTTKNKNNNTTTQRRRRRKER